MLMTTSLPRESLAQKLKKKNETDFEGILQVLAWGELRHKPQGTSSSFSVLADIEARD